MLVTFAWMVCAYRLANPTNCGVWSNFKPSKEIVHWVVSVQPLNGRRSIRRLYRFSLTRSRPLCRASSRRQFMLWPPMAPSALVPGFFLLRCHNPYKTRQRYLPADRSQSPPIRPLSAEHGRTARAWTRAGIANQVVSSRLPPPHPFHHLPRAVAAQGHVAHGVVMRRTMRAPFRDLPARPAPVAGRRRLDDAARDAKEGEKVGMGHELAI